MYVYVYIGAYCCNRLPVCLSRLSSADSVGCLSVCLSVFECEICMYSVVFYDAPLLIARRCPVLCYCSCRFCCSLNNEDGRPPGRRFSVSPFYKEPEYRLPRNGRSGEQSLGQPTEQGMPISAFRRATIAEAAVTVLLASEHCGSLQQPANIGFLFAVVGFSLPHREVKAPAVATEKKAMRVSPTETFRLSFGHVERPPVRRVYVCIFLVEGSLSF